MTEQPFRTPFPTYDVLAKRNTPSWNEQTRRVIEKRLADVPPRRFFTAEEWDVLEALCERIVPQPDRPAAAVPIAPWIDDRLHRGERNGYRYADMPPDDAAWRQGLRALNDESQALFARPFAALDPDDQNSVLRKVHSQEVVSSIWGDLPSGRFFETVLREIVGVYYSHPSAWSEIGFGGPASPRGYVRLGMNQADPWEAQEQRRDKSADE